MIAGNFIVNVIGCSRCGHDHEDLKFTELKNPADEWKYFAICPSTEQPILLKVTSETSKPA